jgi:hypothetical protein
MQLELELELELAMEPKRCVQFQVEWDGGEGASGGKPTDDELIKESWWVKIGECGLCSMQVIQ